MEDVSVSVTEAPASSSFPEVRIICRVCQKQFSQYTCPKCNTRYCSLQCYKKHSLRCTESFMRENVMGELQHLRPEDETKKKMLEILKRFHSEEETEASSDDEDMSMLSEETIQKVLSGNEIKLEDLSPEEIKQFQRAIASGELSKMIQPWTPWWKLPSANKLSLGRDGTQLIIPVSNHSEPESEPDLTEIPSGPETPLPPLTRLTKTPPSPLLAVHLVDILYSYCFALRIYNGDWHADPMGAVTEVLALSTVLVNAGRPETVSEVLTACLEKICSPIYKHTGGFLFGIAIIDDVKTILELGGDATVCALCDLKRMVESEAGKKMKAAERKVYFMMCWVHEQLPEVLTSLAGMLEMEKASLSALHTSWKKPTAKGEVRSKVIIEEL